MKKKRYITEWMTELQQELDFQEEKIAKCEFMPPTAMFDERNSLIGKLAYLETLKGFGRKSADVDTFDDWDKGDSNG